MSAAPGKTPAFEIWQEQFRWLLEYANSRTDGLAPFSPESIAVYWAVQSGVPPRAIGRVLGDPDGRRASKIAYRVSTRLDLDRELEAKVHSLQVV